MSLPEEYESKRGDSCSSDVIIHITDLCCVMQINTVKHQLISTKSTLINRAYSDVEQPPDGFVVSRTTICHRYGKHTSPTEKWILVEWNVELRELEIESIHSQDQTNLISTQVFYQRICFL